MYTMEVFCLGWSLNPAKQLLVMTDKRSRRKDRKMGRDRLQKFKQITKEARMLLFIQCIPSVFLYNTIGTDITRGRCCKPSP